MLGFVTKAAIVRSNRFAWRCLRIFLDRNASALAIGKNVGLRPLIARKYFPAITARTAESPAQFLCGSVFFVRAPGMIG